MGTTNMKAFAILALLPFALALPSHPAPTYGGYHAAAPYHAAPAYGHHAAPAYGHHAPAYGGYGYEEPKHNCSVRDVTEIAEVCTPTIATTCEDVDLPIKIIVDVDFTYTVTRTVCSVAIDVIPQEVCTYHYEQTTEATTAKTVPVVPPVDIPVEVKYPSPVKTCVDKPINLPVVSCEDLVEERTITVPSVEDSTVTVAKCVAGLGEPACQKVELTLPKQVCVELVYGYAHEPAPAAPAYAPAAEE